jgi:hypothetical protein
MANTIDFNVSTNAVTVLNQTTDAAEKTAKGFTSAKAELRALNNQLLQMDSSSEEFKKASARAAELKDNISDLSAEINANAGNAFEGLSNNVGLFGSRLMDLDLKGAGQALTAMGGAVSRIDFKTLKDEVGGLIQGFANLAKSILANPILLLAGAIALVVMNMDKLRKAMPGLDAAMGGLTEKMKAAAKANEASLKSRQLEYDLIMASSALMKEQGMTDKEILLAQKEKAKVLLEQKKITDAQNIANAKADLQRNENLKMVLKGIQEVGLAIPKLMSFVFDAVFAKAKDLLSYVGITIDTSFSAYDTIAGAQMVVLDAIFGNTQEQLSAITEMENQALLSQTQLANTIAQTGLDIKKIEKDNAKDGENAKKQAEKDAEEAKKRAKDLADFQNATRQERLNDEERIAEEIYQSSLTAQEKEIDAVRNKYFELITLAEYYGQDATLIKEEQAKAEAEINKKYSDAEIEAAKKTADEKLAAEQAAFNARIGLVSSGLDSLVALNDAFTKKGQQQSKKQFQINKALNLASAVVDTYGGINRALNDKTMPSTTARIIQASIVGAMGLANVLKISKTEYGNASAPSGTNMSAGGGGDNGTTAPSPTNFAFLQNQPNQQPPLQAYVVGTQVSSNLEAQQLIQNQSRLGG